MKDVIDRGFGFDLEFLLQKRDGSPEESTGTTAVWKLGASDTAPEALLVREISSLTLESGQVLARVSLTAAETEALTPGQYYHQLAVTLAGDEPRLRVAAWIKVKDRL